jgi:hypothetical protein
MLHNKIREYIETSGIVDDIVKVINTTTTCMLEKLHAYQTVEEIAEIKQLNEKYMLLFASKRGEFIDMIVNLYAEFYTEDDIDALLNYYNSPVAKKVRLISDHLTARALEISSDFNKELLRHLDGATLNREIN